MAMRAALLAALNRTRLQLGRTSERTTNDEEPSVRKKDPRYETKFSSDGVQQTNLYGKYGFMGRLG